MKTQYIFVIIIASIVAGCRHTPINSLPITISYNALESEKVRLADGTFVPYRHPQYDTIKIYADNINAKVKNKIIDYGSPVKNNTMIILTSSEIETFSTFPHYMVKSADVGVYLRVPFTYHPSDEERKQLHSRIKSILDPLAKKLNGKLEDYKFQKNKN